MAPSLRAVGTATVLACALLGSAACGSSDDESPEVAPATTAAEPEATKPEATAEIDRTDLRQTLLEELATGTDLDEGNEAIVDCIIDGMDPAVSDETALRVAGEGPADGDAEEKAFDNVLVACLES